MQGAGITKVDTEFAGPFCYRRLADRYLLTNDFGAWQFVSEGEFKAFAEGDLPTDSDLYGELKTKGFIHGEIVLEDALRKMKKRFAFLDHGPSLHTLALTSEAGGDLMTREVGERAIDIAFISTAPHLDLVFVGGPPGFNWEVLEALVDFSSNKNRLARKELSFTLRGDLALLDVPQRAWLVAQGFHVQALLDEATLRGEATPLAAAIASLNEAMDEADLDQRVEAQVVVSEGIAALGTSVVETLTTLGCESFEVLPAAAGQTGVSASVFQTFYGAALAAALGGCALIEKTAAQFLTRILEGHEGPTSPTRSPSTDGIGELAYAWNGTVYSCDEGRILGGAGDPIFALGNAVYDGYHDMMTHPTVRALVLASIGDGQPGYASWAYKCYCGPRPSRNYLEQGSLQGRTVESATFLKNQYILDTLFQLLRDDTSRTVLSSWTLA